MLELYLRGRSMRIIEFFKRLFHREKPIEIKQKKYLNPPKKMKKRMSQNLPIIWMNNTNYFKPFSLDILSFVVCQCAKTI